MKKLFNKAGFGRKKADSKKDGDSHPKPNEQRVSDRDASPMLHDAPDIKSNYLNREELNNSIQAVSQAIESTHGITGRHEGNKLTDYDGQLGISIVERLSVFTNAVQKIADAHPYSKMAWMIISGVVTTITYTQDIDQDIQDLFETLDATYKFIEDTKEIETVPAYERILADIAKQTVDCAYFIRDYTKNSNFWIRAGKNLIGRPIRPRVQSYQDAFAKLLAQFQIHSALHTEIATSHISIAVGRLLECNQSLRVSLDLDSLPYAGGAGLQTGKQCLMGTRTEVLDEIVDWINDADENCPRLFWLSGPAGVGKSAIAHSIASRFEAIGRLGSFFCFDKNDLTKRQEKVFSTIARDLADLDPQIKHQLAEVIQTKASLRSTTDLHLQWKDFIFQPLHSTSEFSTGPILVVIDALDESGDPISRQDLLNVLGKEIPSLPPNVRFLVTSRPERDIRLALSQTQSLVRSKMMDTIPETETNRDILTYFKTKLVEEGSGAFEDSQLGQLVVLSQGLFQWAFLASQFLNGLGNTAGLTVAERYEDLINVQRIGSINDPLDAMYTQILSSLFNSGDPRVMTRFHSIIGSILVASESLSLNSLVVLRGDNILPSKREADIKEITQHMGALLSGINDPSSTIRQLHLSFREYLLDKNRSHNYSVDLVLCHKGLALGCLRTMMEGLKFNICSISTSHRTNLDDKDLPKRISSKISIPLSYSSRFWATHVTSTVFDRLLAAKTESFLYHGFLLWLEVLSLLKTVKIAVRSMSDLAAWSSGKSHEALYKFVADGKRFVRLFIDVISMSAPHIYISALPFCPQNSIIYQTFIGQFPNTLQIASEPITHWPLVQQRTSVEPGYGARICFSHGGEYLAVGVRDVFRLLDAETLDVLWTVEIPENTKKTICAIEFYPSDKHLVFATSLQVYLFDIVTGNLTKLHDIFPSPSTRTYIHKFSLNAKFFTCIHEDPFYLTVWNLQTQECVVEIPWQKFNHQVPFYDFSNNDGDILVIYLPGIGVQVWDLQTSVMLPELSRPDILLDSLGSTTSLFNFPPLVSPNGTHIVFPQSNSLHVWNLRENSVTEFRHGTIIHYVLAISPNGDYVVAGGVENVILYDMQGNNIRYENISDKYCYAFSKDSRRFVINDSHYLKILELDGWQSLAKSDRGYISDLPPAAEYVRVFGSKKYHLFCNALDYEIWDPELNQSIHRLSVTTWMSSATFSPMTRYLGWTSWEDVTANVYDIGSGTTKEYRSGLDQGAAIRSLAFSEDETLMATLAADPSRKTIHICTWDIYSSKLVNTFTIPDVIYDLEQYAPFRASPNFQYFAYWLSAEISLYSHTSQSVPLTFLPPCEPSHDEDFAFSFYGDSEHLLTSRGPVVFDINLVTNEHQEIALQTTQPTHTYERAIYSTTSRALLLQIDISSSESIRYVAKGYNIWNAFTGELIYSLLQPYPSMLFVSFIPDHQYLVTSAMVSAVHGEFAQVWKPKLDEGDWIRFSSDEKHSLKSLPRGSSALLKPDGWVITGNDELLFWVPSEYHQILHIPQLKYFIGRESTKLDLSSFAHGKSWTACCNA